MRTMAIFLFVLLNTFPAQAHPEKWLSCQIELSTDYQYEISIDSKEKSWLKIQQERKTYSCPLSIRFASEEETSQAHILSIDFLLSSAELCQPQIPLTIYKSIKKDISFEIFKKGKDELGSTFLFDEKSNPLSICDTLAKKDELKKIIKKRKGKIREVNSTKTSKKSLPKKLWTLIKAHQVKNKKKLSQLSP